MKAHAFLILAHNNPEYLKRLIEMLDAPNHFFFVHVDKKYDSLLLHPVIRFLNERANCKIFSEVRVNWGGFSQVQATFTLINQALKHNVTLDYFHLISGCDLPLLSAQNFDRCFEEDSYKGHVGCVSSDCSKKKSIVDKYRLYNFNDFINRRNHNLKTILCRGIEILEKTISKVFYLRKDFPIPVYKGSQWWSLSKDAVLYINDFLNRNPWYVKRFAWTSCSDEIFFQTILFNSPLANRIEKNNHRYIDWRRLSKNDKPPRILTEQDISEIEKGDYWFARKTSPEKSAKLIEYFESRIKNHAIQNP